MVKVVATSRGYIGLILREVGDAFDWPDDLKLGSWVKPAAFGGKGDHDGDGKVGGSVPARPAGDVIVPVDWRNGSAAERKALAKEISGSAVPNAAAADEIIEAHVAANAPAPFSDAPAPETVEPIRASSEINDALGTTQPDWVMPTGPVAVED